ncbi:hypothetical protein [Caldovatus aquaticus]|uniref:Uncharacterized protein n=1 Tax=Caldovatus aquaticus TaxID=2865671 RepID=A0ABS7F6U1_9PROT|nr:hypothetical protein [Caldovatus aquaticus]MBW8271329.1 hypothetical protein [Caldovatus aquaticus]
MTRRGLLRGAAGTGAALLAPAGTAAQPGAGRGPLPHAWLFGAWTGGLYPPIDTRGPGCFAQPTVIFTRDVIMRVSSLDLAYRQRLIETVAALADGALEIRLVPVPGVTGFGGRAPPDIGFGCSGNPNLLRVERRGPDEIAFTDCAEFPAPLRRCTTEP